ncbi:MAG TPA: VCBS repeat-containing protein, partial [Ignavibacteriaceae bacterium]|nr:VCBS repeat-containing protein [Ignavibacteriaceae bacterium]
MKYFLALLPFILSTNIFSQNWLKVDSVFSVSGVTVKNFSAPFFSDIDNDSDLDLFIGNIDDITDYFQNNSNQFPTTFSKDTSLLWNIYSGGLINTNSDYPILADLDNDNDFDLVIGGFYGLLYYENTGTISSPNFVKNDSIFGNVNLEIGGDPKPAFADIDDDGDFDLFVGIGESFNPGPTPGLTLGFRNTGSSDNPEFTLDNTLINGIPDVGLNSYPAFADLDNDEDYDLLIGRDGSSLYYYKNTGTNLIPQWTINNSTISAVETSTYWKNPTFADLDNDGDFDLVYGTSSGTLYVYRNNGTLTNPNFQYYPDYFKIIRLDGNSATVSLADFDNDGDNDLLSGIWTGEFIYFRNDGNDLTPIFNQTTMSFSNLTVNSYSCPVFVDIDKDLDYDIVSGALSGQIFCYINTNGSFVENTTIFNSIDVGFTSIPVFADIDADDDL